jgi:drug/metabolite transporter (DMT)-like permease
MQTLIVLVLLIIVGSLGSALYYLLKDRGRSPRTVKALTFRIGLSIALFVLLLLGFQFGLLHPHGMAPGQRNAPPVGAVPTPPAAASVPR